MYHLTRNPRWKHDPEHSPYIAIGSSTSHEDPGTLYVTGSPIYWRRFLGGGPLFLVVLDTSGLEPRRDYYAPNIETYPQYLLEPHAVRVEEVLPLAQAIRKAVTDPNRYPVGSIEDWWDHCVEDWDIPPYNGQLVCTLLKGAGMGKLRAEWRERTGFKDPYAYYAATSP
jgi:hypothetical protein